MTDLVEKALLYLNTHPWANWDFLGFAQFAQVPLADVYQQFQDQTDVVRHTISYIDTLTNQRYNPSDFLNLNNPRDCLLELFLQRFEVMQPYQPALSNLWDACRTNPSLGWVHARESHIMMETFLQRAHLTPDIFSINSLYLLYIYMFHTWLQDKDPMMSTTMSKLDQGLSKWLDAHQMFKNGNLFSQLNIF